MDKRLYQDKAFRSRKVRSKPRYIQEVDIEDCGCKVAMKGRICSHIREAINNERESSDDDAVFDRAGNADG